ncbi:thiolase domain-containing protein [candidate division WOR-3 bacterium]|uniref:Thiolase domain-containing protein n=1 Tax=candidate division WOR-3 bacterium TaxID=2052148 RepID=A0A660SEB3_UNCW3|nr:MAG: thiolase domain-containing protein [candidate division WOR-3 bacterium]
MREVAIIGCGMIRFGELWKKSLRTMFVEAALKAIDDAGVDRIDALYVGCMTSGLFVEQEHLGALLADYLGLAPIPAIRLESACASGGVALRQGFLDIGSGNSEVVLVGGVEKMTDTDRVTDGLASAADQEYEVFHGVTFPGLYAMIARLHMEHYGTKREDLALVAVKNHKHGTMNPHAHFQREITVDQVLASSLVADPLRLLDCSPVSDGAACVVLSSLEWAKAHGKTPVKIIASAMATDTLALHQRKEITTLGSVVESGRKAYAMAGVGPDQIDFAEVHDCFTIAEIVVSEDLGFFKKGEGGKAVREGLTGLDGKIPINPSGGLKAKGHPVGATGVAQAVEAYLQLTGRAEKRQIKDARIGLIQNMGGSGASSVVHILEVV